MDSFFLNPIGISPDGNDKPFVKKLYFFWSNRATRGSSWNCIKKIGFYKSLKWKAGTAPENFTFMIALIAAAETTHHLKPLISDLGLILMTAGIAVLIFKKFNQKIFFGFPLTSKLKIGPFYSQFSLQGREYTVLLSQLRLFDAKRLTRKYLTVDWKNFETIRSRSRKTEV